MTIVSLDVISYQSRKERTCRGTLDVTNFVFVDDVQREAKEVVVG